MIIFVLSAPVQLQYYTINLVLFLWFCVVLDYVCHSLFNSITLYRYTNYNSYSITSYFIDFLFI